MKKITLLVASIFLVGSLASASENPVFSDNHKTITAPRYSFDEPISFVERGIEFYVFPNGEFDFNTRPQDSQGDNYYKTAGRRVDEKADRRPENYGVRIEHDAFGRVRRVGNTFINYDYNDRVSRIGTIYMRYNRFVLSQVGGLRIIYNRRGDIVDMVGVVNGFRNGYYNDNYNDINNNNHNGNYNSNGNYNNGSNQNPNDSYYYKTDGTKSKIEDTKEEKTDDDRRSKRD
jgi:hypothetical protein